MDPGHTPICHMTGKGRGGRPSSLSRTAAGPPARHTDTQGEKKDSTMGKLMEKAGDMLGKDNIAEKGRAKREEAARTDNTY